MSLENVSNRSLYDLVVTKLEDTKNNVLVPAGQTMVGLGYWTPWVDNQHELQTKSIVIVVGNSGSNTSGYFLFEHDGKIYTALRFEKKRQLLDNKKNFNLIVDNNDIWMEQ
ncbi:hypothetical protein [Martelella endophytica]|uniref:hypothetical protein n=1 Tax=Martelella endophytica TaxID=1486262 RepID=UPI0011848BAB|nr:hypothetical protein [Martelella endophytica]